MELTEESLKELLIEKLKATEDRNIFVMTYCPAENRAIIIGDLEFPCKNCNCENGKIFLEELDKLIKSDNDKS